MNERNEQIKYHTEVINGILHMECKVCGSMQQASLKTTAVTCDICVRELYEKDFPFEPTIGYKPTGKPRGWAFMKEYVDKDGNVYHRGKEQPGLKGKLKPTVIKPKSSKPKLTKIQKQRLRAGALAQIHILKKQLNKAKFKKDIKRINSEIKKLEKTAK
tara:strand:- start:2632 stop:3108 length:477 start_codon:yes stop_codon:yes gene_type:complete